MPSHRINLRGPWDYEWLSGPSDVPEPAARVGTVAMPRGWQAIFGNATGTARFRRKFHRPTNLDPDEQVFIVLTEVRGRGTCELNGHLLDSFKADGGLAEFEMTRRLESFNELSVEITFDACSDESRAGGLFGVVAIEIRSPS